MNRLNQKGVSIPISLFSVLMLLSIPAARPVNVMGHSSAKTSSSIPLKLRTSRTALWPAVTLPSACGSHSKRPTTTVFSTKVVRSNLNVKPVQLARGIAQLDTMVRLHG